MLVEPAEHWAAHALNTVGIAPPSSSRPHTVKAPRPQGAAPRPVSSHASTKPKVIRGRPDVAFSRTPEASAWYNEVAVEAWERRAAARIGVVLPGGETPRPQSGATEGGGPGGGGGALTTERLWAMHAGETSQPRSSRGATPRSTEQHGTPRSPGRQSDLTPRSGAAPPAKTQASLRPHSALSDRHSAGEAQREAVRSAVSYFYRFAERHIDGETSAVSSAADVQATSPSYLPICSLVITPVFASYHPSVSSAADVQATSPSYLPICSLIITSSLLAGDARRAARDGRGPAGPAAA